MSNDDQQMPTILYGANEDDHAISLSYKESSRRISCVDDTFYLCCNHHMKKACITSTPADSIPLYNIQSRAARCKVLSRGEMSGRGNMSRGSTFSPSKPSGSTVLQRNHGLAHALLSYSQHGTPGLDCAFMGRRHSLGGPDLPQWASHSTLPGGFVP